VSRLVVAVALVSGCGDAVTLVIDSDRPIPRAFDSICVGVADVSASGGHFGRLYPLVDKLATLPQSLRIESGGADAAWAWVRGDRGGVPAVRAGRRVDFGDDVRLSLDSCERGASGTPEVVGDALGPAFARLVVSHGANGQVVVAIGETVAVLDAERGKLVVREGPLPPAGTLVAAIAADVDGDCDDDLVVATTGEPPVVWIRDDKSFTAGSSLGDVAVAALAAADVDRDGAVDLVTGAGGTLALWFNDGSGAFMPDDRGALAGDGRVVSISALAFGDFDGNGHPDLIVGQAGAPLRGWVGEPGGTFTANDAVVPARVLDVARLEIADVDGDYDPDLAVSVVGAEMKLYLDREGQLEDQTFSWFQPTAITIPTANAIAIGGWDGGCRPDALIAGDAATDSLRGNANNTFEPDGGGPGASDVVMTDLDDDGDLDAVISTDQGARWLVR
jgi:hypothetical protein